MNLDNNISEYYVNNYYTHLPLLIFRQYKRMMEESQALINLFERVQLPEA